MSENDYDLGYADGKRNAEEQLQAQNSKLQEKVERLEECLGCPGSDIEKNCKEVAKLQGEVEELKKRVYDLYHHETENFTLKKQLTEAKEALSRAHKVFEAEINSLGKTIVDLKAKQPMSEGTAHWYCPTCKERLEWDQVTFEETCVNCGSYPKWIPETVAKQPMSYKEILTTIKTYIVPCNDLQLGNLEKLAKVLSGRIPKQELLNDEEIFQGLHAHKLGFSCQGIVINPREITLLLSGRVAKQPPSGSRNICVNDKGELVKYVPPPSVERIKKIIDDYDNETAHEIGAYSSEELAQKIVGEFK